VYSGLKVCYTNMLTANAFSDYTPGGGPGAGRGSACPRNIV